MWPFSNDSYYQPTEREREEAAQLVAPARGTYEDPGGSARGYWEALVAGLLVCALIATFGVAALYYAAQGTGMPSNGTPMLPWQSALLGLGLLAFAIGAPAVLVPLYLRLPARRVTWSEGGLQVTKYYGGTVSLRWDELLGMRERYASGKQGRVMVGLYVVVAGGRSFTFDRVGGPDDIAPDSDVTSGYTELVAALKCHIWARGIARRGPQPAAAARGTAARAPARIECPWCGETFAAGTAQCPQCGRPVAAAAAEDAPPAEVLSDRPQHAPLGRIVFPRTHQAIFYPGRMYAQWWLWVLLALTAAVAGGFGYHYATRPLTDESVRPLVWATLVALGSIIYLAGLALGYLRAAVALTGAGLYYRGRLGRVQFFAWEGLEKVAVVRRTPYFQTFFVSDCASSTFVTGAAAPGGRTTLRIATSHQCVWFSRNPGLQPDAIASALIRHAGLVADMETPGERTWVRPRA